MQSHTARNMNHVCLVHRDGSIMLPLYDFFWLRNNKGCPFLMAAFKKIIIIRKSREARE